jgi:acetyl esterase
MELDYERIDAELLVGLAQLPDLNITRENVTSVRRALAARPPVPPIDVIERQYTLPGDGGSVALYVYRKSDRENQPVLLWIHGGGYILGSAEDARAKMIASNLDCTVVSVDYRLAPEHPFPAALNDCHAALCWLNEEAQMLGIDPARIAIGGASAGAGLAAGLALKVRDEGGPDLVLQLLLYPMLDNLHATDSGQFTNHPVWNQSTSFAAWEMYLDGVPGDKAPMYAAAARCQDLSGVANAYLCVGTEDLFYDEDRQYAARLTKAGVSCELAVFPGLYHGADSFLPQARVSQRLQASFMAALSDAFREIV